VFVLTALLRRFRLRQAGPRAPQAYAISFSLPMKGGLPVLVAARA
jgi:hypothetical protein